MRYELLMPLCITMIYPQRQSQLQPLWFSLNPKASSEDHYNWEQCDILSDNILSLHTLNIKKDRLLLGSNRGRFHKSPLDEMLPWWLEYLSTSRWWQLFHPGKINTEMVVKIFGSHFILAGEAQWDPSLKMQLCNTYLFRTYLANLHLGIGYHGQPLANTNAQPGHAAVNFSLPERLANLEKRWENRKSCEREIAKQLQLRYFFQTRKICEKDCHTAAIENNLDCKCFHRIVDAEEENVTGLMFSLELYWYSWKYILWIDNDFFNTTLGRYPLKKILKIRT